MPSSKKIDIFLGNHHKKFLCRRCLSSNTSENLLEIHHKPKCESKDITTIKTSSESQIFLEKIFS